MLVGALYALCVIMPSASVALGAGDRPVHCFTDEQLGLTHVHQAARRPRARGRTRQDRTSMPTARRITTTETHHPAPSDDGNDPAACCGLFGLTAMAVDPQLDLERALASFVDPAGVLREADRPRRRPHQPATHRPAAAVTRRRRAWPACVRSPSTPRDDPCLRKPRRRPPWRGGGRSCPFGLAGFACTLLVSACQTFSPDGGMDVVAGVAGPALDKQVVAIRTDEDAAAARATLDRLLRRPLTADAAVQVALLDNRGLQAAYDELAAAEARMVGDEPAAQPELLAGADRRLGAARDRAPHRHRHPGARHLAGALGDRPAALPPGAAHGGAGDAAGRNAGAARLVRGGRGARDGRLPDPGRGLRPRRRGALQTPRPRPAPPTSSIARASRSFTPRPPPSSPPRASAPRARARRWSARSASRGATSLSGCPMRCRRCRPARAAFPPSRRTRSAAASTCRSPASSSTRSPSPTGSPRRRASSTCSTPAMRTRSPRTS